MVNAESILPIGLDKLVKRVAHISCLGDIQYVIVGLLYLHSVFLQHICHIGLMMQAVRVRIHLVTGMDIQSAISGFCHAQGASFKGNIGIGPLD